MTLRAHWRALRQALRADPNAEFDDDLNDMEGMIARLKPKAPMLTWVHGLPKPALVTDSDHESSRTLETLHADAIAFRLPPFATIEEARAHVERRWKQAWDHELTSWTENRRRWPLRNRAEFDRWFEIEIFDFLVSLP